MSAPQHVWERCDAEYGGTPSWESNYGYLIRRSPDDDGWLVFVPWNQEPHEVALFNSALDIAWADRAMTGWVQHKVREFFGDISEREWRGGVVPPRKPYIIGSRVPEQMA